MTSLCCSILAGQLLSSRKQEDVETSSDIIQDTLKAITAMASKNVSVLSLKSTASLLDNRIFEDGLHEMEMNVPFLYDLLDGLVGNTGNKQATMTFIYAMILNSRNRCVSAVQRCMSLEAIKCHADNQVFKRKQLFDFYYST